jgi:hypothetical protein
VLSQVCLAHVGGDTQEHICVEWILHWTYEEGVIDNRENGKTMYFKKKNLSTKST